MERKKEIFFWWKKCFGAVVSLKKLSLQTIDFISLSTFFQTSLKHFWSRGILSMWHITMWYFDSLTSSQYRVTTTWLWHFNNLMWQQCHCSIWILSIFIFWSHYILTILSLLFIVMTISLWHFDNSTFWQCGIFMMGHFDKVAVWKCGILTLWHFYDGTFWQNSILKMWHFDTMAFLWWGIWTK